MAKDIRIAILGDASDFTRATRKALGEADGFGSKMATIGKRAAIGFAAVGVGAGVMAKGFVDAATESQKVTAQTDAVIKSMGNAAGVTAQHVADLSTSLSLKSGIDDELIQSGSNVLLTFGQIRNEVGKGNDIFDRANAAALDMSVALGKDLAGSAMTVGKALNDPVRGLTALRRSGIQFTKQQEDQIKAMTAAGDTAGAQKIMLAELERQFGGSAAAQATATDKLGVAWGNIQEQLGAKLLPVVERFANWMAAELPRALATAEVWFDRIGNASQMIADAVREHWPQIQATIVGVVQGIQSVVTPIIGVLQSLWDNFGNNILEFVQRVWPRIQQIIEGALTVIRGIIQTVTSLIQGDWSGVWEGIKSIVSGAWELIQGLVGTALEVLRTVIGAGMEIVGSVFKGAWEGLVSWLAGIPESIGMVLGGVADLITAPFRAAFNAIADLWNNTIGALSFKIPTWVPRYGGKGFDVPDIPKLHDGGMFRAPAGSSEGLALLRDGERVLTPEQQGGISITINGNLDRGTLADLIYEQRRAAIAMAS